MLLVTVCVLVVSGRTGAFAQLFRVEASVSGYYEIKSLSLEVNDRISYPVTVKSGGLKYQMLVQVTSKIALGVNYSYTLPQFGDGVISDASGWNIWYSEGQVALESNTWGLIGQLSSSRYKRIVHYVPFQVAYSTRTMTFTDFDITTNKFEKGVTGTFQGSGLVLSAGYGVIVRFGQRFCYRIIEVKLSYVHPELAPKQSDVPVDIQFESGFAFRLMRPR